MAANNPLVDSLKDLRDELSQASCIPKEPFVKLGTGTAPTLNYNIPQTTCFSTYGNIRVKGTRPEDFLDYTKQPPPNNFFQRVEDTPVEVLQQKFSEAVQLQSQDSALIPNNLLLRKHLDLQRTDFDSIALALPRTDQVVVGAVQGGGGENGAQPEDSVIRVTPFLREATNGINEVQLARLAKEGQMPYVVQKFGEYQTKINFLPKPPAAVPYFVVIEEYRTCSYLGDYGAGRTIKTFSLLPGEKTTITVRTYKDVTTTQSYSENVMDSFSESSTSELEKNIENENSLGSSASNSSSSSSSNTNSDSSSKNWNVNASVSASLFGIVNIGAGGGGGGSSSSGSSSTSGSASNATGTRTANVKSVNRALDKHVATSNSNRQINVNTSTTDTAKSGEEDTTVRELLNYNKSRVLNFVFRQLLQEYITITYLSNIRIAYCNGYVESLRVVDLEQLDELLADTVQTARINDIRTMILKPYCTITNYQDDEIDFIEQQTVNYGQCLGVNETEQFWRIKKGIQDSYTSGGLNLSVKGVILSVAPQTLRTSSMIVDALMGQGEALDCYNQKVQDAEAIKGYLNNLTTLQQIEAIEAMSDPEKKAELYKKIFGTCCDTPQTQIIH